MPVPQIACLFGVSDHYEAPFTQNCEHSGSARVGLAILNFVITPRFGVCHSYALRRWQRRWGANVLCDACRVRCQAAAGSTGVYPPIVVP